MAPRAGTIGDHVPTHPAPARALGRGGADLDWRRVWRVVRWPLAVAVLLLACQAIPALWGWRFAYTATGQGSWSMANEGGVMPCSVFYIGKAELYQAGDVVSFWYQDPIDPAHAVESTIKRVAAVKADGTLICRGDNQVNSDLGEYVVSPGDVRGKLVAGPVSVLPTAYWRWLSLDWTLQASDIALRTERIYSVRTLANAFTAHGRWMNAVELGNPPRDVLDGGKFVAIRNAGGTDVFAPPSSAVVFHSPSRAIMWRAGALVVDGPATPTGVAGLIVSDGRVKGPEEILKFAPPALPSLASR